MKIKVLEKTKGCMPEVFDIGDWYDLKLAEEVKLKCPYAHKLHQRKKSSEEEKTDITRDVIFDAVIAKLGVCMQLPKGFEAIVVPRSSTFKKFGVVESNSIGVIDGSYCGNNDEWKMPMIATKNVTIPKYTRIAQFRIQLSQKATVWQKLKWLLSGAPKLVQVPSLNESSRGGFGEGTDNK